MFKIEIRENLLLLKVFSEFHTKYYLETPYQRIYYFDTSKVSKVIFSKYEDKAEIHTLDLDSFIELLIEKGYEKLAETVKNAEFRVSEDLSRLLV